MTADPEVGTTLESLLEFVKETRGFDFTGYKRSSIERRVAKRMADVGVTSYDEYLDYLELHSDEFSELFNTILINVTGFFRDRPAWEYLASEVVPQLLASRQPNLPVRIWVPGTATGEEDRDGPGAGYGRAGVPSAGEGLCHRRRRGGA